MDGAVGASRFWAADRTRRPLALINDMSRAAEAGATRASSLRGHRETECFVQRPHLCAIRNYLSRDRAADSQNQLELNRGRVAHNSFERE
jgi:hypothetical protein